jgi:predicted metal-dependent enzyme (double-stranded beta helix superfamily)
VPRGAVRALDVDPELVRHVEDRAKREGARNVTARLVARDDPAFEPGSVDLVFLCDVYHHIDDRVAYFRRLAPALKPDGRVVVVDFEKRRDVTEGPPFDEKLARETVEAELGAAGFRVHRAHDLLPIQYFVEFRRAAGGALGELVRGVSAAVRGGGGDAAVMARVAPALERFLAAGELDPRAAVPHPGLDVTTVLLHAAADGGFSIAALVIRPGAATPIHDHGTWTVWGTLRGDERETRFRRTPGQGSGFPDLVPDEARSVAVGRVSLIPGPPGDIHRLDNVGATPSVSIHVHGADLSRRSRNAYDPKKRAVIPFVQSYETLEP